MFNINPFCESKADFLYYIFFGRALVLVIARYEAIFSKLGRAIRCNLCCTSYRKGFPLLSLAQLRITIFQIHELTLPKNYLVKTNFNLVDKLASKQYPS